MRTFGTVPPVTMSGERFGRAPVSVARVTLPRPALRARLLHSPVEGGRTYSNGLRLR